MNLKSLATRMGLSQTTVSRALNGHPEVSESTRARVVATARAAGYQPSPLARRLALGKADAIGIVHPAGDGYLGDARFLDTLEGLTQGLNAAQIDLLITSAPPASESAAYERLARTGRVDGFIVPHTRRADPRIRLLQQAGIPFVAYGRTNDPSGFAWLDFDNDAGCALAVRRLHAQGHRAIGYVHAPLEINFAWQRHRGFLAAMRAAGLDAHPEWMVQAEFTRRGGHAAMQRLLTLPSRPTAVLVDNNVCGAGATRCVLDLGLRFRSDISVIVYDGVSADSLLDDGLITCVDQPTAFEAGMDLAQLMLGRLQGLPVHELQRLRPTCLREGASDGPVGEAG